MGKNYVTIPMGYSSAIPQGIDTNTTLVLMQPWLCP